MELLPQLTTKTFMSLLLKSTPDAVKPAAPLRGFPALCRPGPAYPAALRRAFRTFRTFRTKLSRPMPEEVVMFAQAPTAVKPAGRCYNPRMVVDKVNVEEVRTASPAATQEFGRRFAARLKAGDCVALVGELGAGKTVLVRGIAAGLGLADERWVSSPSFVLVQEYPARVPIFHVDLYRLTDPAAELSRLGIEEMLDSGVVLIEWADRAPDTLPPRRWQIELAITGKTSRLLRVQQISE
jgi:tRNA threonylcarbamoyl adenosine modification protein YjeE